MAASIPTILDDLVSEESEAKLAKNAPGRFRRNPRSRRRRKRNGGRNGTLSRAALNSGSAANSTGGPAATTGDLGSLTTTNVAARVNLFPPRAGGPQRRKPTLLTNQGFV